MYCYQGSVTNKAGDAQAGWLVECLSGSTVQTIYSDNGITPLASNRAISDSLGNFYFYVTDGTYTLKFYNAAGVFQRTSLPITMVGMDTVTETLAASALKLRRVATFAMLATTKVAAGETVLIEGYAAVGDGGHGYFVADALATAGLVTAHPLLASNTATTGVWVRALPYKTGTLHVRQAGAKGVAGQNDQPAIQAAQNYAAALGGTAIEFCPIHESRQRAFPGGTPEALTGYHLVMSGNVPLIAAPGGTTITLKRADGTACTPADGTAAWNVGWLTAIGTGVTKSVISGNGGKFRVEGGVTFANVYANTENNNGYFKGVAFFDNAGLAPNLVEIDHRDLEISRIPSEIWYMGGTFANAKVYLENPKFEYSPQCCFNPGTVAEFTVVNPQFGFSYQPVEGAGSRQRYIGGRIYDSTTLTFIFTESFPGGYAFSFPHMTAAKPTYIQFDGTRFERIGSLSMTCRVVGEITTVDSTLAWQNFGRLSDVALKVTAILDQANNIPAMTFSGPATLTTQVTGAPVGIYYETPRNFDVELTCKLTNDAKTDGRKWSGGVRLSGGLCEVNSCRIRVNGELIVYGGKVAELSGPPASGSQFPLVIADEQNSYPSQAVYAAAPNANFTVNLGQASGAGAFDMTMLGINPIAGGVFAMTYTNTSTYALAHGQRMAISHNGPGTDPSRQIKIAPQTGLNLQDTRFLYYPGDRIMVSWDQASSTFNEVEYVTRLPQRVKGSATYDAPALRGTLVGSATYDAPSIAAGGTASTTVTVTGALLGEKADASFGVSTAGLVVSATVTAANTVTVVLQNPTAGAIDLLSTTLTATVGGPTSTSTTVTAQGANMGDYVDRISLGVSTQGLTITGYVSATNTVTVVLTNNTTGAIDLGSTTLSVEVARKD